MGKFLKKNWFVVIIAILFIGFVSFYIYDTNKGKLKGKTSNGEDVVFEINGNDVVASSFYDELYKTQGTNSLVTLFEKTVADASVPTTSEIKDNASKRAETIRANYESSYGSDYESQLQAALESTGYTDLEEYLIDSQKINQVTADYAKKNFEDLKIRQISYILIKYDNSSKTGGLPSENEQSKMDAVDAALKDGSFADAAIEYSEDSSTASTGGNLGVIDKNASSLDTSFLEASLALKEGEVSDWVQSDSFGFFKIMCTAGTAETLEANNTDSDPYVDLVQNYDTTLKTKAIWEKAQELGVDFKGNEDLEKAVKTYYGVNDSADTDEKTEETTEEETTEDETDE